jgi:glycosyltransferase involved in cell wall biosynthesis
MERPIFGNHMAIPKKICSNPFPEGPKRFGVSFMSAFPVTSPVDSLPRVIDFGFRHNVAGHGRSHVLVNAIEEAGFHVNNSTVAANSRLRLPRLLYFALTAPKADIIFVRSPTFTSLLRILEIMRRRTGAQLVYDAMLSAYETQVEDRQWYTPGSKEARRCLWEDHYVGRSATLLVVDTKPHAEYLTEKFACTESKMEVVPVGSPLVESVFGKKLLRKDAQEKTKREIQVLYVGNYVPLHGVDLMIQAARHILASRKDIHFTFIGRGQDYNKAFSMAKEVSGLVFEAPKEPVKIIQAYLEADIVLGVFGSSEKAKRIIPLKAYDALALGKPLVIQDSFATRHYLQHEVNAMLVARDSGEIAKAVVQLADHPQLRAEIGANARARYEESFSSHVTNKAFLRRFSNLAAMQP